MTLGAKEIAFVGYPVTDVQKARKFYEETLGLTLTLLHEIQGGQWWVEYTLGTSTLAISNAWPPTGESGPGAAIEVEDLDAAWEHCSSSDVEIAYEIMETPVCRFFGIKDPDKNDLTIHQTKQAQA